MVILAKLAFPFDPAKTAVIVVSCIRETSLRRLYYDVRVTLLPLVISAVFAVLCSSIFVCLALTTINQHSAPFARSPPYKCLNYCQPRGRSATESAHQQWHK